MNNMNANHDGWVSTNGSQKDASLVSGITTHRKIFLNLGTLSALTLAASAQLPDPLLYYPFDEMAGATQATDLSANNYTGDVVGGVVFGVTGAPGGATPLGAAQFSVDSPGIINVSGLNVPELLGNRDGTTEQQNASYTMACWILPDPNSISGNHFIFGQSVQGIHNGLRDNGRLHQAHWSADHYANTQLNSTDWVHVTFTYDGITDTGTIYLNGTADSPETPKEGPNGSGNFVIGARQGDENDNTGEANYVGLIDEVVVYQEVLSQANITALALGASPVTQVDTDSDGMGDDWEIENLGAGAENDNGDTNPDFGPNGDPDSDFSNNLEEFTRFTNPQVQDTDGDGIWDGYETGSTVWASETSTGTDPRKPDSDGDGLSDGVENPDLAFVDEFQTGSDPNKPDTDLDGFTDLAEVFAPTNPNDIGEFPAPTPLPLVDDFEGDRLNGVAWLTNLAIPQGGAKVLQEDGHVSFAGRGHLYTRTQYDPTLLGGIYIKGSWTFTGEEDFLQILTRSNATPAGDFGETETGIEFSARQSTGDINIISRSTEIEVGAGQRSGSITLTEGTTYEFIVTDDGAGALGFCIWESGNRANAEMITRSITSGTATANHIAIHNRESSTHTSNLEEIEIGVLSDTDSDGMPDFWENDNGFLVGSNDASADADNDGLSNLGEYLACTDPNDEDTDNDGLEDGVENNDNTFNSLSQTGTDPLNPDSDDDGLGDSVENPLLPFAGIDQPGTDPNNADSDGDTFDDRLEIVKQSDPTDIDSLPKAGVPILYYSFEQGEGDVILDQTFNYFDATVVDSLNFVGGAPGGSTPGFGIEFTAEDNGYLNVPGVDLITMIRDIGGTGNGSYTMSSWLKPAAGTAGDTGFIFGQVEEGLHLGIRNGGVLHTAHWYSDFDANTILEQDTWVHATWTYDGATDTANIYLNGVLDGGPFTQTLIDGAGNLLIGAHVNNANPETRFKGCLDEIAVWDEILPLETIQALAAGASPIGAPTGDGRLQISDYDFNFDTGVMSLTWNSSPNATYSVNFSTDLEDFDGVINAAISSEGNITTLTFNRAILGAAANAPKVFFRVSQN